MRGNNNKIVKKANRYLILDIIRSFDTVTLEEIVDKTRLSYLTVRNIVQEMINEGIVEKSGFAKSTGGRQPTLYCLNATSFYSIGVDLAFPCLSLAFSDLKGNIIYSTKEYLDIESSERDFIEITIKLINRIIEEINISRDKITGLGVGISGIINTDENILVHFDKMPKWKKNFDIGTALEEKLKIPVYIQNDVHLLGLIEKFLYLDNRIKNFIYISVRIGIGMAIFINGELFEGNRGNAGYIGHTQIAFENKNILEGKGWLETMVNNKNIVDKYNNLREQKGLPLMIEEIMEGNYIELFIKKAIEGDEEAKAVLLNSAQALGISISNVIKILDFSHVIIGGLPDNCQEVFLPKIKAVVNQNTNQYIMSNVTVECGQLSYEMAALGGCLLSIENFFLEPKLKLTI